MNNEGFVKCVLQKRGRSVERAGKWGATSQ